MTYKPYHNYVYMRMTIPEKRKSVPLSAVAEEEHCHWDPTYDFYNHYPHYRGRGVCPNPTFEERDSPASARTECAMEDRKGKAQRPTQKNTHGSRANN